MIEKLLLQHKYLFNEYFIEAIKGTVKTKTVPRPIKMNGGK